MFHGLPHNERRFKYFRAQLWILVCESFSSSHDAFHKLDAASGITDEVEAFRHQEIRSEHHVVDPGLRYRSQCISPKACLEAQDLAQEGKHRRKYTYWILGVMNSKSGYTKGRHCFCKLSHLLTTQSSWRVGVSPSSCQPLRCLDENTAQVPRLKLDFCIYWKIAAFVYNHTNRLTALLPINVFSSENSRAKSGIYPSASEYIGIEQLRRRLFIDII